MNLYESIKSNLNEADDYSEDEPIEVPVSKEEQRIIDFANEVINDLKSSGYKVGRVETEDSKYPICTISKNRFSADIEFSNPTLAAGALKDNENLKESEDEIKNFYYDSLLGEHRQVPSRKQYEEEISKLPNLEDYADVSYEGFIHSLADSGVITDEEAEQYLSDEDK